MSAKATPGEREALRRWALRGLATQSLYEFTKQAWHVVEPGRRFSDNWHIGAICEHLMAVTLGQIQNLLINVPPGCMKSMLVCVMWPVWEWASNPSTRQMFASYSAEYATRDSVKCRNIIESQWYQGNWGVEARDRWGDLLEDGFRPVELAADQNQKTRFQNTQTGWRFATSTRGGTGDHPDRFGIDDPHNVMEAESDASRREVVNWTEGVMSTRGLIHDVRRVGIMQRLHAQDWAGTVLEKRGADGRRLWVHICLPMRYESPEPEMVGDKPTGRVVPRMEATPLGWSDPRGEEGELLWPERYPEEKVKTAEVNLGSYNAAGQLQQRPAPRGGGKFKRVWVRLLETAPACAKLVRYWDKAGTSTGTGARTAGVLMGLWHDSRESVPAMRDKYVVLDVQWHRVEAADRESIIKQVAQTDRSYGYVVTWVEQEPGSGGKESAQFTVANLGGFTVHMERVTGSKDVRADPMAAQASVGKLYALVRDWTEDFLKELEQFPVGKLKDAVDAGGGAFNKLHEPTGAFGTEEIAGLYTARSDLPHEQLATDGGSRLDPGDMG